MTTHEIRMGALNVAMIAFRADGPCTVATIRRELLEQATGVDRDNLGPVTLWVMKYLLERKMIRQYEDMSGVYEAVN